MNSKRPFPTITLFIIALLLLSFWLRLHNIDTFSFWTDEGLTPLRSGYSVSGILDNHILIQEGLTNDTHPPLFYLIIHFSRQLFGETDFAFRFPSTLAGVLLVPLMFQFGRRLGGKKLGSVVGVLTAVNPLQIYYANEARMYTIFVLLAAVATYILWRAIEVEWEKGTRRKAKGRERVGGVFLWRLVLYLVFAGLALYTHYTAVFLIGAQGLFWIWLLWRRGQRKWIMGIAVAAILVAVPLIPYTIPRLFKGAEANFYLVSPWVMLQDVVRFFGLGFSVDFDQPVIQTAVIFLAGLLFLGIYAAKSSVRRLFLSSYLLAAVFGLMAGSLLFKPMYQGARHIMVGSPAFLLLIGLGMMTAWNFWSSSYSRLKPPLHRLSQFMIGLLVVLLTAVPLVSATYAINNLYNAPTYAKDNFREMIRFIEQTAGDNDVIVYNNAILLPLHDHYHQRDDIFVTASPIYPSYAINTSAPQLEQLAQEYDRIWFITDPPADKRDNDQLARKWLDEQTTLIKAYPFPAKTTALSAIVYDTAAQQVAKLPTNGKTAVTETAQWSGTPQLQGVGLNFSQPVTTPTFWVDLFWQEETTPAEGAMLRFSLIGPDGKIWATSNQRLILEADVAPAWDNDGLIRLSYPFPLPMGMPSGQYTLNVEAFTADEMETGLAENVAQIVLSSPPTPPLSPALTFRNGLSLQSIQLADSDVRPGHTLPMTLFWQADEASFDLDALHYELEVRATDGTVLRQQSGKPAPDWLPQWPANQLIREDGGIYFHPETVPGRYLLYWRLFDGETAVSGRPSWRPWNTQTIQLGEINVIPWPLETNLPESTTIIQAQFGDAIQLYGADIAQSDGALNVTLHWQATAVPTQNYTLFVHLLDEEGNIVSQRDAILVDGLRPTKGWRMGEVLRDTIHLSLPDSTPSGAYNLVMGLYLSETGERPLLTLNGIPQPNNQLLLKTITLP